MVPLLLAVIVSPPVTFTLDETTAAPLNISFTEYSFANHIRFIRESRLLIGPFDLKRKLKKKLNTQQDFHQPSASPLRSDGFSLIDKPTIYTNNSSQTNSVNIITTTESIAISTTSVESTIMEKVQSEGTTETSKLSRKSKATKISRKTKTKIPIGVTDDEAAWPGKRAAVVEGDVLLGGLMMVI
ncbi:unnamed protein product [Parnassius apollo]|uniref:(apollo) hypothetical protein n=1 Tax=Parnassius apollo TaxID=110799 RepID=A0A8S3XLK8_PARAO|nr:unnamed protein product [Parnassius apollo]